MPAGVYLRTAQHRATLSVAGRGKKKSAETRARMSEAKMGHAVSASTAAKLSAAMMGRSPSSETRAKLSAALTGRTVSSETRSRLSCALRGRVKGPLSAAHRAKLSVAGKRNAKTITPEMRLKLINALRIRTISEEERARRAASQRLRKATPETKARLSASIKRAYDEGRKVAHVPSCRRYTRLAQVLHAHLTATGLTLEPEVRFGKYTVDLYDRAHHVAYEADGRYWHERNEAVRPGYHARRDAYLRDRRGLVVIHFTDAEIKRRRAEVAA